MCTGELPSRRNRVERIETAQGAVIRKTFPDAECAKTEGAVYRMLAGTPLPHAQLLKAEERMLSLRALPGITFSELLERQESDGEADAEPWRSLLVWIESFCHLTGMTLTDCNLRNFLYDADTRAVYGVDFEECRAGTARDAIARLCAHILLHRPEETGRKRALVSALCASASEAPTPAQIEAEIGFLRARRAAKKNRRFSAAVLSGGKSSRMGRDKAALPYGGVTLLEHQTRKLRSLGIEDIMISGCAQAIPGTRFVPDVCPGRGPLSGIHACLSAAEHEAVLFLTVDTPLIPLEALQALLDAHTGGVTLLRCGGRAEPLPGVYDRALVAACGAILRTERTAVRRLLDQADVRSVPFEADPNAFLNCNTPEEYASLMLK